MLSYAEAVTAVIQQMREPDSKCKDIRMSSICYQALFKYLVLNGIPFSMDAAVNWLETKKKDICADTYSAYRRALFRLEHYLLFGNIDVPFCASEEAFLCRSGMSESFFRLNYELKEYFYSEQNPEYYHTYSVAFKEFFRAATAMGITEPEAITINVLLEYWDSYCAAERTDRHRQHAVCAMTALTKYLYKRGDVPRCYSFVLANRNAMKLKEMQFVPAEDVFHPSSELEGKMDAFFGILEEWKYKDSSLDVYRSDFMWYFMFLEINHIQHSDESMDYWESISFGSTQTMDSRSSFSDRRHHVVRMFDAFLKDSLKSNRIHKPALRSDSLPDWSRNILTSFINNRRYDGMTKSTLDMCRTAGCNFFVYLEKNGVTSPDGITPEVVQDFHRQDSHSTPEAKNAYSIKLRQLLCYMANENLIPSTLVYSIPTACAPRTTIVNVLSDDAIERIYEFRKNASSPLELRDIAMVMLGLRMGIRGIDIIHLQITDFNWDKQTVSFIQRKTRTAITLPVPTDVGNSVYKYIIQGRPQSADAGNGYIFIRHQAPHVPFSDGTVTCKGALKRVLGTYGIELQPGQGFHMTRKTFATRMLRADNKLDDISNALGHAQQATAEVYLERDEDKMRLCPLEFGGVM